MAAASAKSALLALKTPVSATYPSELRSPLLTPSLLKREDAEKTPITPPVAYVDFLKALSPALMSPMPTGTGSAFTFEGRLPTPRKPSVATPADRPASPDSAASSRSPSPSASTVSIEEESTTDASVAASEKTITPKIRLTIPSASPHVRSMSAKTPRLLIPPSPGPCTSMSARSPRQPFSAISPGVWSLDIKTGQKRAVSVRQVVTRTITYTRAPHTPLEPAPKTKRRRIA